MSVELIYKHQQKTYELMIQELAQGNKVAYVFPVGAGKSFPALKYIEENKNKNILLVSSQVPIINQFKDYIKQYILNGKKVTKKTMPNFRAITYQKIALATELCALQPDIIIFDEIHRIGAEHWEPAVEELLCAFPNAKVIGMSATPKRTDKRNMAYEKFDSIVYEMSLTEALSGEKENEVVLKGARYERLLSQLAVEVLPKFKEQIELTEDEKTRKILIQKYEKLQAIVANSPDIQDVMAKGMKKKNGKYIVFCSNRDEMFEKMSQAQEIFGKVNSKINVDYVISKYEGKGKTKAENRRTLEEFEAREENDALNLLFCVDMLNEGVHLKGISGEVMFSPVESHILYKQRIGRVLSADKEAEETVIIDAVNNWLRQIDTFKELQYSIQRGNETQGKTQDTLLDFIPEELQLLEIIQEIQEVLWYNNKNVYEQIVNWLQTHNGNMPRGAIFIQGHKVFANEKTPEEKAETQLYQRWHYTPEYRALQACIGIPIDELPLEYVKYREQIATLRSYGYGTEAKTVYEQIIEWLETHNGQMPRSTIKEDGEFKVRSKMTLEEQEEINLYNRWQLTPEYKAIQACKRYCNR